MIIKSFNVNEIKKLKSNFFLFYGENEGHKEEIINDFFIKDFKGEIIKYEEKQILENKELFFEVCLNESLFEKEKIIQISRVSSKLYDIIKELYNKNIYNKKIILNSDVLEKKSKIRQLFEVEKDLICIPFYQDNNFSLYKIANEFFKKNKISISSENINLIIEKCSGDRKNLQNEMNKILNYCFNKRKISRNEILKLINLYEDENYFELIDYCLAKDLNKVRKIINNNSFRKDDAIILIRSFLSRLKRLIELKKLFNQIGDEKETINRFKPPIFWKDKEIVQRQMETWPTKKVYNLFDEITKLEINFKKNYDLSNNIIFDFILNTSNKTNN
tara:strand:+ start:1858 stop:2853 length:996 start_codon:yes stop_codon:yes gene_type:complete